MEKNYIRAICLSSLLTITVAGNIFLAHAQWDTNTWTVKVLVTEKVPGANCVCAKKDVNAPNNINGYVADSVISSCNTKPITERMYICEHGKGIEGFQDVFKSMVQWIIYISILLGVLAIASLGIAWAVAGSENPAYKKFLKDWVINLIIGLIILFTFRYILGFLAPWIFV